MTDKIPLLLASSIVRLTRKGDSHGFLYLVDFNTSSFEEVYILDEDNINWEGRGGDRGFRGITYCGDYIYIPIGKEIFKFDSKFTLRERISNQYLENCHEIATLGRKLYVISTSFDSVLEYNTEDGIFSRGLLIRKKDGRRHNFSKIESKSIRHLNDRLYYSLCNRIIHRKIREKDIVFMEYDPCSADGPDRNDTFHLNSISVQDQSLHISGSYLPGIYKIENLESIKLLERIPYQTHNAQIRGNNMVCFNHTGKDNICLINKETGYRITFKSLKYREERLMNNPGDRNLSRQGFARGMAFWKEYIFIGTSPATVSMYSLRERKLLKKINLSYDIRNAIHGLELFPF